MLGLCNLATSLNLFMVEGVNSGVKSGNQLWGEAGSLLHAEGAQGPAKQERPAVPLPI